MRRLRFSRLGLAACIACVLASIPLLAIAAMGEGMPFTGTYQGMAGGQSQDKKASRGVTVYVEQVAEKAKVTFLVAGFPALPVEGVPRVTGETALVPFTVDEMGVTGSGTLTFQREGGVWTLVGSGEGSAMGYDGTGEVAADRVSSDVAIPDAADQWMSAIKSLGGALTETTKTVPPPASGPVSPVEPVKTTGPVSAGDAARTYALSVLVLFIEIILA
jgi:hypothetical protein